MGENVGKQRMACARGSRERANSSGGNLVLNRFKIAKAGDQALPISTTAAGFLSSTLIMLIKGVPKFMVSRTNHRNDDSRRSKAFIVSNDRTAAGEVRSWALFMT